MLTNKRQTAYKKGVAAEKVAARYLEGQGYEILQHRYKGKGGEIDLIALKGEDLVFVEVKAHADVDASLYAVTAQSRRRIEQAALQFISEHTRYNTFGMRFDVIVIPETLLKPSNRVNAHNLFDSEQVHHLDNAWFAGQ